MTVADKDANVWEDNADPTDAVIFPLVDPSLKVNGEATSGKVRIDVVVVVV